MAEIDRLWNITDIHNWRPASISYGEGKAACMQCDILAVVSVVAWCMRGTHELPLFSGVLLGPLNSRQLVCLRPHSQ